MTVTAQGLKAGLASELPVVQGRKALGGLVPVLAVLLLGLALRLYHLDFQSLWGDEDFAVRLSREPLSGLLPLLSSGEPHPPLYFLLLHVWRVFAGGGDFSLRLLSTIFSTLTIAATFALGLRLAGRRCAIAAALIVAANPFQVWYAQEVRMYGMLVALTTLSALLFFDAMRNGQRRRWALYVVVTALALYTHYHALFIVLFENVFAALCWLQARAGGASPLDSAERRLQGGMSAPAKSRWARGWIASQIALLAVFAPWVYQVQQLLRSWAGGKLVGWPWQAPPDLLSVITLGFSRQTLGTSFEPEWTGPVAALLALLVAAGLVTLLKRDRQATSFLALYAVVPFVAVWLLGQVVNRSLFHERFLIGASPALYLLLAQAGGWRGRRAAFSVLGILVILGAGALSLRNHYFDGRFQKDDLHGVARYIDARAREGDLVVASITRSGLYQRYAANKIPIYVLPTDVSPSSLGQALSVAAAGYKRVWFLPYAYDDADLAFERWIAENGYPAGERWFNTARVEVGGLAERKAYPAGQAPPFNFANRLRLNGFGVSATALVPGDVVGVALDWAKGVEGVRDVKASLRLIDAKGHTNAQIDRPVGQPPGGISGDGARDNLGLLLPVDMPPGDYKLELRLYDVSPGGRDLPLLDERGNATGTVLGLGGLHIDRAERPAPLAAVERSHPTSAGFGAVMRLVGFELPAGTWRAGDRVAVTLQWQGLQPDGKEYRPVLRLVGANGEEKAKYAPSSRPLPISQWRAGELIREIYDWRLPPGMVAGSHGVTVGVESPDGAALPVSLGGQTFKLGTVITEAKTGYAPPTPAQHPTAFTVGRFALLEGYDVDASSLRPGDTLRLTLHWKAADESEESYKVFTHLLSPDERVWGQQDSIPCEGGCPTSGWAAGEAIADRYALKLQADAPPGSYRIEIGMYNPVDGKRLPVTDGAGRPIGDRIIFAEVTSP